VEKVIILRFDKLPEGMYLATRKDLPGLIVQGDSIAETLERKSGTRRNTASTCWLSFCHGGFSGELPR